MRVAVVAALAFALPPLVARADPTAEEKQAQALQVEGLRLMQKGDNKHALEKFEAAYRLVPSPRILFNRGKAHNALGHDIEALSDFERFLDEAPYAPKESRDEATRVIEKLRPKLAYLDIDAEDTGADVSVDGRAVGTAPLPRPVVVARGRHEVKVTKSGMNDDVRAVAVIPGQKLRVSVRLTPVEKPAPPPVATTPKPVEPNPTVTPTGPAVTPPGPKPGEPSTPEPAAGRPWQTTAAWVAAGAGVVFLGAGITAQVMTSSKYDEFNNVKTSSGALQCNEPSPNAGGEPCQSLLNAAHTRQTIAIVGFVAAGLAAAGSVVLFLTAPSQGAPQREVAVGCAPSVGGAACALEMRF